MLIWDCTDQYYCVFKNRQSTKHLISRAIGLSTAFHNVHLVFYGCRGLDLTYTILTIIITVCRGLAFGSFSHYFYSLRSNYWDLGAWSHQEKNRSDRLYGKYRRSKLNHTVCLKTEMDVNQVQLVRCSIYLSGSEHSFFDVSELPVSVIFFPVWLVFIVPCHACSLQPTVLGNCAEFLLKFNVVTGTLDTVCQAGDRGLKVHQLGTQVGVGWVETDGGHAGRQRDLERDEHHKGPVSQPRGPIMCCLSDRTSCQEQEPWSNKAQLTQKYTA